MALLMRYSGIPLCEAIGDVAQELWAADQHTHQPLLIEPRVNAPGIELRYRMGTHLTTGAAQVLDIASGLTPRGLHLTPEDPDLTYVEFDLPLMIDLKTRVIAELTHRQLAYQPANLHLEAGNALETTSLQRVAAYHFDAAQPTIVTTEGLLHYLTHPQKAQLARGIGSILLAHPDSVWYTDMPVQQGVAQQNSPLARTTSARTGRNVPANRFATPEEAMSFFDDSGLTVVARHSYVTPWLVDALISPAVVGLSRDELIRLNRPWSMYEIRRAAV
jgi:O-methyltransferase involved in polyketide biosynthesis